MRQLLVFIILLQTSIVATGQESGDITRNPSNYNEAPTGSPTGLPDSVIQAGNAKYDGSISGLRSYLNGIRSTKPQLFAQLDPELRQLESKKTWSTISLVVGGLGAGLLFGSFLLSTKDDRAPWAITGGILAVGGIGAGLLLAPRSDALNQWMNHHNRMNPEVPLKWHVGFKFEQQKYIIGSIFQF